MATRSDPFAAWLLTLDDDSFFAVVRNYLGPVQTPYNKQELIARLVELVSGDETASRVTAMLDATDRLVLAALLTLPRSERATLIRFLAPELPEHAVAERLFNLHDRLLVVSDTHGALLVNPYFLKALAAAGVGDHLLVGGTPSQPASRRVDPWLTTPVALAVAAVAHEAGEVTTREGRLRKRVATLIGERFGPRFGDESQLETRFLQALEAMERLHLVRRREDISLRPESWEAFAALDTPVRESILWAATIEPTLQRAGDLADVLRQLVAMAPADRSFTVGEMTRLVQLCGNGLALGLPADIATHLEELGVLQAEGSWLRVSAGARELIAEPPTGDGSIRISASMEITVPPAAPLAAVITIARVARLVRLDTVATWELTEGSVSAARRDGVTDVRTRVEAICGTLPQNVRFLLERWDARAASVRLVEGLVVVARGDEERLVLESAPTFLAMVRDVLADGVFLLHGSDPYAASDVLRKLGVAVGEVLEAPDRVDIDLPDYERIFVRGRAASLAPPVGLTWSEGGGGSANGGAEADLRAALREELLGRSYADDVTQEMLLRIERGLVLYPDQLRPELVPQFGNEARGLDYVGKVRLIESAIRMGDRLELIIRDPDGEPQHLQAVPREVIEQSGELMMRALQLPDGRPVRVRIRRMSLVRRLSGTLIRRVRGD